MSARLHPEELRDEEAVENVSSDRGAQWVAIGRHARKNGVALRTILTNNPRLDPHIRQGWEEQDRASAAPKKAIPRKPAPFSTDLFGNKLSKPKGKR